LFKYTFLLSFFQLLCFQLVLFLLVYPCFTHYANHKCIKLCKWQLLRYFFLCKCLVISLL
jgi:predicted ABC-type exoprotein transport system permease subunit